MNNFDLKKFLVENKLTANSRLEESHRPPDTLESLASEILEEVMENIWSSSTSTAQLNYEFNIGLTDEQVEEYEEATAYDGRPEEFLETFDHFVEKKLIEDPYFAGVHLDNNIYEDGDEELDFDFDSWENRFPETIAKLRESEDASSEVINAIKRLIPNH